MSASTVSGVDTVEIHYRAPMNAHLKRPALFARELQAVLAGKDTISWQAFRPEFVRFWFHVSGPHTSYDLYLAQGATLVYGRRLYRMDRDLFEFFRRHIPEKKDTC